MTERVGVGVWKSAELDSGNIVDLPLLNGDNLRNELPGIFLMSFQWVSIVLMMS